MENATRTSERCESSLATGNGHVTAIIGMTDEAVQRVVHNRKQKANYNWSIDPNRSLCLAESLIQAGTFLNKKSYIALGKMARGDALKFIGHLPEAWRSLAEARDIYQSIGDEVGWARACIGPLYFCDELGHVDETLKYAERAQEIFAAHNEQELLVSLEINLGVFYNKLRECNHAIKTFQSALKTAQTLGTVGEMYLGRLNLNIGYAYQTLGDFRKASVFFNKALDICIARNEDYWAAYIQLNLATLARTQGNFKEALRILHQLKEQALDHYPLLGAYADDRIVTCYIFLNRHLEAYNLLRKVVATYDHYNASFAKATALFNVATLEAELLDYTAAYEALVAAEKIFDTFESSTWNATLHLWRATIALKTNDPNTAYIESVKALREFASSENIVGFSNAVLRQGQALYEMGDIASARLATQIALKFAQRCHLAWNRYSAHLLLGRLAEAEHNLHQARRHYQAAMATIERVQRRLSLTMRPEFLENKADGFRALMRLCLDAEETASAFETIERVKSLAFLSYLNSRDSLRWEADTPRSQAFLKELNDLRDEHQWYYHLATSGENSDTDSILSQEEIRHKLQTCERRMRTISEQLYINSHDNKFAQHTTPPPLSQIQAQLPETSVLLEYYNDGEKVWVFVVGETHISVHELDISVAELDTRLQQLQLNISSALQFGSDNPIVNRLTQLLKNMSGQLYSALIQPVMELIKDYQRLTIVPFGNLHYLPFHLLYSSTEYLIEQYEVVILPTASLTTHPAPQQPKGAVVIGHSDDGKLTHILEEAKYVHQLLGGDLYCEDEAVRPILNTPPRQVLHVAAHGEFRIDNPDLSYIKLEDGQLFTDDLLQHDLSYELITLSACETGLSNVTIGDELIGLGRGCLYAGAGALLVSLWKVEDNSTQSFMEHVYQSLYAGLSKAAALRSAQCQIIARHPTLHPAFWGAFQLIGNGDSLSNHS